MIKKNDIARSKADDFCAMADAVLSFARLSFVIKKNMATSLKD